MDKRPRSRPVRPDDWAIVVVLLAALCVLPAVTATLLALGPVPFVLGVVVAVMAAIAAVVLELSPRPGKRISGFPPKAGGPFGPTISDPPGWFPYFGTFFFVIGVVSIAIVAGTARGGPLPLWELLLASVMAIVGVGGALYVFYQVGANHVQINLTDRSVTVSRRALPFPHSERHDLRAVQSAYIVQGAGIDGHPVFTLRMGLWDGREVPLTRLWIHEREPLEDILFHLTPLIPRGEIRVED